MLLPNILSVAAAVAYTGAYGVLTAYTHFVEEHRDMFPYYVALTIAAAIHSGLLTMHTWHKAEPKLDEPTAPGRATPIAQSDRGTAN